MFPRLSGAAVLCRRGKGLALVADIGDAQILGSTSIIRGAVSSDAVDAARLPVDLSSPGQDNAEMAEIGRQDVMADDASPDIACGLGTPEKESTLPVLCTAR